MDRPLPGARSAIRLSSWLAQSTEATKVCSPRPAGLATGSGAGISSPGVRAGGTRVHVPAGRTVRVHEAAVWVSDKHRLAERVLAQLATLPVREPNCASFQLHLETETHTVKAGGDKGPVTEGATFQGLVLARRAPSPLRPDPSLHQLHKAEYEGFK